MTDYRYSHYDVFTDVPFKGNPLAVVLDARGLTDTQMQAIAREMAFSETTFVLPAERDDTDVRMRIFTPNAELPMAGHPTVGTTFALAAEGAVQQGSQVFTFGLGVGPTAVDLEWKGSALSFAWMTQPLPQFGDSFSSPAVRGEVAAAIGLDVSDLHARVPVQSVSSGVPFAFVPLRSREAVDRARPNVAVMEQLSASHGIDHYYVFTVEYGIPDATAYSRMFAPVLGILEDPATGGACGPLGAYLLRHGLVRPSDARVMRNLQGEAMRRPSWISIDVECAEGREASEVQRVRVGGRAVLVASGILHL